MIYTLISEKNRFKGNMHCHTTLSDGRLSPEDIVAAYKSRGYSFLALSDHNRFYEHNDLSDSDMVVINAYEQSIDAPEREAFGQGKCYHFNFFAKSPEHHELTIPEEPSYYDFDGINNFIKNIKSQDFLCSYNHPYWSLQNFDDYKGLEGVDFVEIYNHGCFIGDGLHENQINVYDDMLRWGKSSPLYCTMTDDNHNHYLPDEFLTDSFGGWVVVDAEKLDYVSIMNALAQGKFYCSNGPVIKELTYDSETKKVTVKSDPAYSIALALTGRKGYLEVSESGLIDTAEFTLKDKTNYFRIEVTGANGKRANSIAYYLDDLK